VVRGGIEVSAVGPDKRMNFWVNSHLIEQAQFAQRAIEFTRQDGKKINRLSLLSGY
jgi:hypothetical protein